MKFRFDGSVQIEEKRLPRDIDSDVYVGLFEEIFQKIDSDFLIYNEDDDPISIQLSLAMDLHHFIDVYQLKREALGAMLEEVDIHSKEVKAVLSYNEEGELTVDFHTSVSATEVFVGLIILAGELLDEEDVNTLMMNIIEDLYNEEEVVN
jgi:hypothetical protein